MFWNNLENLCKSRNITPNKLAKELNFSNAIATAWKKGSPPNTERLIKIADYFGVSTDYLLGRTGSDPDLPEDEKILLANYRKADDRGKKRIQRAAEDEAQEQEQKLKVNVS
ncbi:MAG: helix-turn-helix transcriptional regulator [Lachnospiraceae bacterium]|nr:helix-turn-helix transcriptional regulator [Lachnospiraceae bacterium]